MAWPIVASAALEGAKILGTGIAASLATDYLSSKYPNLGANGTPTIPTKKGVKLPSKKVAQRDKLKGMSEEMATALGVAALAAGTAAHNMATSSDNTSTQKTAEKEALKQAFPNSPLIKNQIEIAQSSDAIVDAINANSIVSATVFGTLNANLSAISASLLAISGTLIEISDNYKEEIEKAEDLPYIDSDTFYDLLEKSGMSHLQAYDLKNQELAMVDQLSKGGHSYSEIKQAIQAFRNSVVPSDKLLKVGNSASGITSPSPVDSTTGQPISNIAFPDFKPLFDWAKSAKVREDYLTTPSDIKDINGVAVASAIAPMAVSTAKDVALGKGEADENSIGSSVLESVDDLFDDMDLTPDMLKDYLRVDAILNQAKITAETDVDQWESLMEAMYRR